MSKAARGTKRVCKSCAGRFYDLNLDPIVCPLCGATYETEEALPDQPAASVEAPVQAEEAEGAVAAAPEPQANGPEVVSLEDARAEEEEEAAALEGDDELADLADDDAEIPADDAQDAFLEEDDEAEPDVSGIIGGAPLKPAEES